jgi:glycerol kinase
MAALNANAYILGIDQGTTSSRAVIYDKNLKIVSSHSVPFNQYFPKSDWVEHDLEEIWKSVVESIKGAISKVQVPGFNTNQILTIGMTNQRETFGLWDKATGKPVYRAIVWQCRRSAEICHRLKKTKARTMLPKITGLVIDPYFSGTKLKWIFESNKDLLKKARNGELCFGTMDTFLLMKLTGGQSFATEPSNASRTMLMDLKTCDWSPVALKILGIPKEILPNIKDSNADFGSTRELDFLPDGIKIHGILGDQQAALYGQECFEKGDAKITYGTGAFFLVNTGSRIKATRVGVTTVSWRIKGRPTYALEGSVFIAGAAVQWLRDGLGLISKSSEIESLARSVTDSDGVFFIPALTGLGAPDWAPFAKGLIGGLTRRSSKAHIARATLEGIANSIGDTFSALVKDSQYRIKKLRVDGGASANNILMDIQSSALQVKIDRPVDLESTVRGVSSLAAIGAGLFRDDKSIVGTNPVEMTFSPTQTKKQMLQSRKIWERRKRALILGAF